MCRYILREVTRVQVRIKSLAKACVEYVSVAHHEKVSGLYVVHGCLACLMLCQQPRDLNYDVIGCLAFLMLFEQQRT